MQDKKVKLAIHIENEMAETWTVEKEKLEDFLKDASHYGLLFKDGSECTWVPPHRITKITWVQNA